MMLKKLKRALIALCICPLLLSIGCTEAGDEVSPTPTVSPINKNYVGDEELLKSLKGIYKQNIDSEKNWGLSDISQVGVDEDKLNTELYPTPADSEFAHIYEAAEYGITPDNPNNTVKFNQLLNQLKNVEGQKKINLPKGEYIFGSDVLISGIEDLYIEGNGSDWSMSGWTTAIRIKNSKNIHINGIKLDYKISPTISGLVKSFNEQEKKITISLHEEFNLNSPYYNKGKINYGSYMEFVYDEATEVYIPDVNGNLKYNSTGDGITSITNGSYDSSKNELTLTFSSIKPPQIGAPVSVAFTMYEYAGFIVEECDNIFFQSVDIYTTPGMAIMCHSVKNLYLDHVNLKLREGSKRLMTATADGLHCIDCSGDLHLTNSLFEQSHDDCVNIHSFYKTINEQPNFGQQIVCSASNSAYSFPIETGDIIEIFNPDTLQSVGMYKVVEASSSLLVYTLTLDKRIRENLTGYLVGNVTRSPKVKIENCIFRNKRNRGLLLQVRDSVVRNCTFQNIIHGAVSIHSVMDIFSEALMPRNIKVENCKFLSNNYGHGLGGDIAVFCYGKKGKVSNTITGIIIQNNFIYNTANCGIYFSGAGDCVAQNNFILDAAMRHSFGNNAAIRVEVCEKITIEDNFISKAEPGEGYEIIKEDNANNIIKNNNRTTH